MKNLFKKTVLTAALMGAFSVVAMAEEAQPIAVEAEVVSEGYQLQDPVATVNGKEVSKAELENFLLLSQGVEVDEVESPEVAIQLVKLLGTQDALADEAKKRGLDKDEGYQLKMRLIGDLFLADLLFQNMIDKGEISQEELKAQYDAAVKQLEKNEYQASHILVESEDEANAIIADIKSGKTTFAEAAKEKSLDTATASRDGSIGGWFRLSMMDPSFGEALKGMEKGKMSETPVESQFGYHVIVLDDVRDLGLDIKPFDELDEETKLQLAQPLFQKYVEEVQEKVNVELPKAAQ
ncbi:peptidylprolyl isomerase [Ignatzschineria cameli]|uniref:peptidylprolyl isomerase n=1 Tax=Ignatzschineria cameli TaxID=2182793 RepID=A0A2U2ALB8_9GAMM|nr:peptidylprolyl isomerase [Ignatzschineria cameli]PWD83958.1 hypothetical protein DC077_08810 [Ignatzschineria cameli]PWD85395.1 hypothetical protein DC080_06995 [Ignatzschineria cameli]PWD87671.1 hypothetical protein DC079_10360 [Ignatzschineria cameli]PWD88605.1 hypothetical protein DC081_10505 [Ignatzschineria cameli]PWD88925.1 hypothetical protein DC078_10410 [Ignatzschineria cameli]